VMTPRSSCPGEESDSSPGRSTFSLLQTQHSNPNDPCSGAFSLRKIDTPRNQRLHTGLDLPHHEAPK
jgi:hypothetical protein